MGLQLALIPAFIVLAATDRYFWQRDYDAGYAVGREVEAGGIGTLLVLADRRPERIWGSPWVYPWPQKTPPGAVPRSTGWMSGMSQGLDGSALVTADEPLGAPDRAALEMLIDRHLMSHARPRIDAKLIWDAARPGELTRLLAPVGVHESGAIGGEEIPALLAHLEADGGRRMCPDGSMLDADRAVLMELILARGRLWSVERQDYEMRSDWADFPRRVERLCRAPR